MSATLSPTQSFLADELSTEPSSEEALYIHPADLENGQLMNGRSLGKRAWVTVVRLAIVIAAGIGVVAALAWQSHGNVAKETIAPVNEISPLETMRQSIDALTASTATNPSAYDAQH
jgi:hypothetical protein